MSIMIKISLLSILLGFLIGSVFTSLYLTRKPDGYFFVNLTNPEDEMFKLQIDVPLEQIPKEKRLIFKVKTRQ